MATTTSVENSGLLRALLPPFAEQCSIRVDVLPVGSGQALSLLGRGDVDIALTHDPDAEAAAVAAGTIARYRKVMFNDFVIVGPVADPAGASGATTVEDALGRIASSDVLFVSRGDASGTHARERLLWRAAGTAPASGRHLEAGQGMAATLRIASERDAYALTDRATFVQLQPRLRLRVVFEGGPELLNTYAVFIRSSLGGDDLERASALVDWMTDREGRSIIEQFRVGGQPAFAVWPAGLPRESPETLPGKD